MSPTDPNFESNKASKTKLLHEFLMSRTGLSNTNISRSEKDLMIGNVTANSSCSGRVKKSVKDDAEKRSMHHNSAHQLGHFTTSTR